MSSGMVVLAHVTYIVEPEKLEALAGADWSFLLSPLRDPLYLAMILGTVAVSGTAVAVCELFAPARRRLRHVHDRLLEYRTYAPLLLRLALGIALIVAGTQDSIFLPNVPGRALSTIEVAIGFCLLVGYMVRPSALVSFAIFLYGLFKSHYMLGALECGAASLLVAAYGGTRPSADDVLGIDFLGGALEPLWRTLRGHAAPILRVALGVTMVWLAVTEKGLNPRVSEAVVLDYGLEHVIPVSSAMWVLAVGVIEVVLGLVLVLGLFTRTWSIVAALVLTASFFYFREEVAGHVTFFGSLLVLMATGAGRWSLDSLAAWRTRGVRGTEQPYAEAGGS